MVTPLCGRRRSPLPFVIGSVTSLPSTRTSSGIGNGRVAGHVPANLSSPFSRVAITLGSAA
jgi:hypothetical protein